MAYESHKIDKSLMESPVEGLCGNPSAREEAPGHYGSEPGYPEGTPSPNFPKVKIRDIAGGLPAQRGETDVEKE